jgi:hypothetical protein
MIRYARAFFIALRMTLTGQTEPPNARHPQLSAWILEGIKRVDAVYHAADQHRLDKPARQAIIVRIDGRDTSMEVILGTIRHHLDVEYPYLLRDAPRHYLLAIEASNFNDQYWVERLIAAPQVHPSIQTALQQLKTHLDSMPRL